MTDPTGLTGVALYEAVVKKIAANIIVSAGRRVIAGLANIEDNYGEHLKQSFERCSQIRTVINRDQSVDLLSVYVNLNFRIHGLAPVDDYSVIDEIREGGRIIISGRGGGGKSMFMRYLWLSLFNEGGYKIPLFIELRKFNEIMSDDFEAFLFRSAIGDGITVTQKDFQQALADGYFTLVLDGFDEVNFSKRKPLEISILKIAKDYPNTSIVLSSRPEERFDGWQAFKSYNVEPLRKNQVVDLIQKISYDNKIKRKFIQRIRSDLYDKHQSFLSSPLLATMMLLTYDQFADIPDKIYLFYEQAFETLFAKHDATKEAYKRQSYTGLPIDIFKSILSYFCLITYYDTKFEFNETEVRTYLQKAIGMVSFEVNNELYLRDLNESVCVLQKEGLHWSFSHRSFQEYFSAFCLSYLVVNKMGQILPRIASRMQDSVLKMCFDMNRENLEIEFVLPRINQILAAFNGLNRAAMVKKYVEIFGCSLLTNTSGSSAPSSFLHSIDNEWMILQSIRGLYPHLYVHVDNAPSEQEKTFIYRALTGVTNAGLARIKLKGVGDAASKWYDDFGINSTVEVFDVDDIKSTTAYKITYKEIDSLKKIAEEIKHRYIKRTKTIDEIFNLG